MGILAIPQKLLDLRVIRKTKVASIFEEVYLKKILKEFQIDCVFDVGANNGQYAKMLREKAGYKGTIISFEPIPSAQKILSELAKKDKNWFIEPIALDKVSGEASFYVMQSNQFSSLHSPNNDEINIFETLNKVNETIKVKTATLKEMYEKYQEKLNFKRPFLKMDTQGHDIQIIEGSELTAKKFVGLQSELSIKRLYNETKSFKEVIEYYTSLGFELSAFVPNNAGHFPRLIEIDCIMFNPQLSTF